MSGRPLDPEVFQAVTDLRPVYMAYKKAKADAEKRGLTFKDKCAALEYAGDQRSIVRVRSERLDISSDALLVILAADHALRLKFKRRASLRQLGKALADENDAMNARAAAAEIALKAAEVEVTIAARAAQATQQARIAITGYGS